MRVGGNEENEEQVGQVHGMNRVVENFRKAPPVGVNPSRQGYRWRRNPYWDIEPVHCNPQEGFSVMGVDFFRWLVGIMVEIGNEWQTESALHSRCFGREIE